MARDPFLSAGGPGAVRAPPQGVDFHARQESADSGLGMGPSSYSLPHTPEGFLADASEGAGVGVATPTGQTEAMDTGKEHYYEFEKCFFFSQIHWHYILLSF